MQNQVYVFTVFILNGILIGILFDCFRILRKSFKTPDKITYVEDILFAVLAGLFALFSIMKFNNGEIRLYLFLGITLGLIFYLLTFSSIFIKTSVTIILFIKKTLYVIIIKPIIYLIKTIKKVAIKPIVIICLNIKKILIKIKKPSIK